MVLDCSLQQKIHVHFSGPVDRIEETFHCQIVEQGAVLPEMDHGNIAWRVSPYPHPIIILVGFIFIWIYMELYGSIIVILLIDTGWWLTYPCEKYEFVSWDDEIPNIWKFIGMFQTTSEPPATFCVPSSRPFRRPLGPLTNS